MKLAGLVAAAGLSSRMGGFKPLMELNGFPMVVMTVQSMRNAGIRDITVVVGYRGQEVCEALAGMGVSVVRNEGYALSDMFSSVRLGLAELGWADGVFFLPVDVPMTSPVVFREMVGRIPLLGEKCQALIPFVEEKGGKMAGAAKEGGLRQIHPPLILKEGWHDVMSYGGDRGLGGALAGLRSEKIVVACGDASEDADRRPEFELLARQAKARRGLSRNRCEELYEEAALPEPVREHCRAVGELAGRMAERLADCGVFLDVELCRSGGYLHDLLRPEPHHAKAAGDFLEEKGYLALARVVRAHMGFETGSEAAWKEETVVCLADKLIQGTQRVTVEQRYRKAFAYDTVKPEILRDIRICHRLIGEFEVMTGEKL